MSFLSGWRRGTAAPTSPEPPSRFQSADAPDGTRSLELVRYNADTGKFEVGAEALEILKRTRGPVGVVAVAGRARQGKSYILNQLLGRSGGFQVAPTHRPCTKGLWMWSAPVERTGADGSRYSLVLLDTEGIDAYDQTGQYSTQIFSLAVLLSSLFIYNQMGGIDEAALDRLSLVTEMTKHIRVRASDGAATDASELASFTPSFLWLLRDFYLRLEEDGRIVTPRDYLETALQSLAGSGSAVESKNRIRDSIKALFPDRDCFTLIRPVHDEEALSNLDSLPQSALRPEFRDALGRLTRMIFHKAQPKRLGTQVLTGPVLAGLTEAYVSAINAGAVPTIATAWQGVAEAESRRAADAAEAVYAAAFPSDIPAEDVALQTAHQSALAEAQRAFAEIAIGDPAIREANNKRWHTTCEARFRDLRDKKIANAELACERAINEGTQRLHAVLRREDATGDDLLREATAFYDAYASSKECSGPNKWNRLSQFMRDAYGAASRDLATRNAGKDRAEAQAAQALAQQATARAAATEASNGALQGRITDLERQIAAAHAQLAAERQAVAVAQTQLAVFQQSVQGSDTARLAMENQLREARRQLEEGAANARAWEAERARLQGTIEAVMATKEASDRRADGLAAEVARLQSTLKALETAPRHVLEQNELTPVRWVAPEVPMEDHLGAIQGSPAANLGTPKPDTTKMTIAAMKSWLTEHGHEAKVWEMSQSKAKKGEWEAYITSLF